MMVTLQIDNINTKVIGKLPDNAIEAIRDKIKYKVEGAQFFKPKWAKFGKVQVDEYRYLYNKKTNTFPSGLLYEVEPILKAMNVDYILDDQRPDYPIISPIEIQGKELRDYQVEARDLLLKHKNCFLQSATGSGKTLIFISVLGKLYGYKQIVVVRKQLLFDQTITEIEKNLGIKAGFVGCGKVDLDSNILVVMAPTLARIIDNEFKFKKVEDDDEDDKTTLDEQQKKAILDFVRTCQVVVIDEAHSCCTNTIQVIMQQARAARYRIGVSATPWRSADDLEILTYASLGPIIHKISASFLIDKGMLVSPKIYFLKTPKPDLLVNQQGDYQDVYRKYIVENYERNRIAVKRIKEAYDRFEKIVVLVRQIEHGEIIGKMLEDEGVGYEYIHGSHTLDARKEAMRRFTNNVRGVIIGSAVLNEGIDLPCISVIVQLSAGKSKAQYYQQIGRALRLFDGKKRAIVIDFQDSGIKFMEGHSQRRKNSLKDESAFEVIVQK